MSRVCYRLWNDGLGDHWASLNLIARLGLQDPVAYTHPSPALRERAEKILDLLDIPGQRMPVWHKAHAELTPVFDLDGFDVWATQYFPTKRQWSPDRQAYPFNFICAHFDGISSAADKNPPFSDRAHIALWAAQNRLSVMYLGDPAQPLDEVVGLLANCALFVGCDSGFSHIAHSVGAPTYLLEYKLPVVTCHRHKSYVLCKGAGHFTQQADNWLHYLRTLDALPDVLPQ